MRLWSDFLVDWNGRSLFLSSSFYDAVDLDFSTDAASEYGYGGFLSGSWFSVPWSGKQKSWSMPCQELFPIWVSIEIWATRLSGKRGLVHCDNDSTVKILNKGYTNKEPAADMIRHLTLTCMRYNILLRAKHIPGCLNVYADLLSRLNVQEFKSRCSYAAPEPTFIPFLVLYYGV